MAQNMGFFAALGRFLSFAWLKNAMRLNRKADEMFTQDAEGIGMAFDIQQEEMVANYNELRDAIAQIEMVTEQKRDQLNKSNEEEADLIRKREGALVKAQQAEEGSDEYEKHAAAFERFDTRINQIEETQERLEAEIEQTSQSMVRHMQQLTKMQADVQQMPQEKAEAIAAFVTANQIIALNDRLAGIQTSVDQGPIEAVRRANRELTAKARISERIAGTDVAAQDEEYAQVGTGSTSRSRMEQMLAERRGESSSKQPQSQESSLKESEGDDRPEI